VSGPANPFRFNVAAAGARQAGMGTIEDTVIEDWTFDEQYQTYQRSGFALDVSTNQIIGDINEYNAVRGDTAQTAKREYP
jgi:pre-mRNA-processing factor 17